MEFARHLEKSPPQSYTDAIEQRFVSQVLRIGKARMTLEELRQAMEAAKAKADASADDAALKGAFEAAKAAYDAKAAETEDDSGEPDESKMDAKTQAYFKKLRAENAKHRTKNKELDSAFKASDAQKKAILKTLGIEDGSENPEEKLKARETENNALTFRTAILETAMDKGIAKEDVDYFEYLVGKKTSALKDDEELSDEALDACVADVKKRGGTGKGNTSVGGKKDGEGSGNHTPAKEGQGGVTLDQFCKMSFSEKAGFYGKNPALYAIHMAAAREQRRLV